MGGSGGSARTSRRLGAPWTRNHNRDSRAGGMRNIRRFRAARRPRSRDRGEPSGARQLVVGELLAQLRLEDLAGGAQRDRIDELDVVRRPPLGDLALVEGEQVLARN